MRLYQINQVLTRDCPQNLTGIRYDRLLAEVWTNNPRKMLKDVRGKLGKVPGRLTIKQIGDLPGNASRQHTPHTVYFVNPPIQGYWHGDPTRCHPHYRFKNQAARRRRG